MNNDGIGQGRRSIEVMGSGNIGARGASATASELLVMAAQVLDHPASRLLRTALAHAAGDIIRTQGDLPVQQAIELAPDLAIARAIRTAAEAACEAVSVSSDGTERRARLFALPVVVQFSEPTTTQEFDETLTSATWTAPFLGRLHEYGARHSISCILPHAFLFDDLATLSFCSVRNGTIIASATSAGVNASMITPFPISRPAQRRSATFLRYLVGYQVNGGEVPDRGAEDRARFGDCVGSVLRASMPEAQDVVAIYTGRFYDAIWQGLWIYHTHRLAEVVRIIAPHEVTRSRISASITVAGSRNQVEAQLAFFCRGRAARHHAYSVPIRPLDDPKISAQRIAAELRALGVTRYVGTPTPGSHGSERWSTRGGRAARRRLARNELMLPL